MKVNFELATPNSVHGCTWARPTWRRIKKGAEVHCARAVHVQVFSTHHFLAALRGTRVAPPIRNSQVTRIPYQLKILGGTIAVGCSVHVQSTYKNFAPVVLLPPLQLKRWAPPMPNLQVTCMLPQHICLCGYRSSGVQAARARTGKVYSRGVLRFWEILRYRHQIWYTDGVQ